MVTKKKRTVSATKKGRVKVGTLKLNKETVKDLSGREIKGIKGGVLNKTTSAAISCAVAACVKQ